MTERAGQEGRRNPLVNCGAPSRSEGTFFRRVGARFCRQRNRVLVILIEEVGDLAVVVLGGAGVVMFGMVAAAGARVLTNLDFKMNRYNLFVAAISVGFGMIALVAPNVFRHTADVLQPLLESSILLAAIFSVLLNLFFNDLGSLETAQHEAAMVAASTEHGEV